MKNQLNLPAETYARLLAHLLPTPFVREEAAFLFVSAQISAGLAAFNFIEAAMLEPSDFICHESDYLEMTDATRARLIKRAHDLKASVVEIHSHVGPWPAAFSRSDRTGLAETVPHMFWRLANRPYLAVVVARNGFDALVWLTNPNLPQPLDELIAGNQVLRPTNNSLEDWL